MIILTKSAIYLLPTKKKHLAGGQLIQPFVSDVKMSWQIHWGWYLLYRQNFHSYVYEENIYSKEVSDISFWFSSVKLFSSCCPYFRKWKSSLNEPDYCTSKVFHKFWWIKKCQSCIINRIQGYVSFDNSHYQLLLIKYRKKCNTPCFFLQCISLCLHELLSKGANLVLYQMLSTRQN